jgi:hypothetical protein
LINELIERGLAGQLEAGSTSRNAGSHRLFHGRVSYSHAVRNKVRNKAKLHDCPGKKNLWKF